MGLHWQPSDVHIFDIDPSLVIIIGKLLERDIQEKYIINEDDNFIRVCCTSYFLCFFFCIYIIRDVLLLLSTTLYDL